MTITGSSTELVDLKIVASTRLYLYERMRLTASIKHRKKVCAYEKMCAYKKGALNNPSLRYTKICTNEDFPLYGSIEEHMEGFSSTVKKEILRDIFVS